MIYVESIFKVLVVGLILGAGLPAVFAAGLVAYSHGAGVTDADGSTHSTNPALKFLGLALFAFVGLVILTALAWITRSTIEHHFGINLFPFV